jgi:hypothetical protein
VTSYACGKRTSLSVLLGSGSHCASFVLHAVNAPFAIHPTHPPNAASALHQQRLHGSVHRYRNAHENAFGSTWDHTWKHWNMHRRMETTPSKHAVNAARPDACAGRLSPQQAKDAMLFSNTLPWRWARPVAPALSFCVPARAVFRSGVPSGFSGRLGSPFEAQSCSVTTCPSFAALPRSCAGPPQLQQAQEPMLISPRMLAIQLFSMHPPRPSSLSVTTR